MSKVTTCDNMILLAFVEETNKIRETFEEVNFKHIFREDNMKVDDLSKECVLLQKGEWTILQNGETHQTYFFNLKC